MEYLRYFDANDKYQDFMSKDRKKSITSYIKREKKLILSL